MGMDEIEAFVLQAVAPGVPGDREPRLIEVAYHDKARRPRAALVRASVPEDKWIVPGMTLTAYADPENPGEARIDLDGIPALAERIQANDPTLCELERVSREMSRRRRELLEADYDDTFHLELPPDIAAEVERRSQAHQEADIDALMASRPSEPVRDAYGRLRGTADLVSRTAPPLGAAHRAVDAEYRGSRIYRVWLYGHAPYPVLDEVRFGVSGEGDRALLADGRVPVAVSPTERANVEFLWDEYDQDRAPEPDTGSRLLS